MVGTSDYIFAIMNEQKQVFPLTFEAADLRAKEHFQSIWQRLKSSVEEHFKILARTDSSAKPPLWCSWKTWDWCLSARPADAPREMVVAWCGSRMVGFLSFWKDFPSQVAPALKTLYVEHLGAFPGDLDTPLWGRHYRGVGKALLAYAVLHSQSIGYDGRLALHASDENARAFYYHINDKMDGRLFHPELMGVIGPTPQANRHDAARTYLETTEAGAREWLEGYRDA
jgi:hypothetical protein